MSHLLLILSLFIYSEISFAHSSVLLPPAKNAETFSLPNLRIVGGRPANQSETRHQISLRLKYREVENGFGYGHLCGGSLIGPDLIVTAAHCMYKDNSNTLRRASEFTVVMGTMNVTVKETDTLVYSIKSFKVHKRYTSRTVQNDIALIKVRPIFILSIFVSIKIVFAVGSRSSSKSHESQTNSIDHTRGGCRYQMSDYRMGFH